MKKIILLTVLLLSGVFSIAQKKEKVKGSKIVTVEIKKIESFESLDVADNLEVFLVKGSECGLEIEADDNLHDAIDISVSGSTLKLATFKAVFGAKKFSIRITYTDAFKMVTARNESVVNALADIELADISFKAYDEAKLFLNVKSTNFAMSLDDKAKSELNLKSQKANINLAKNTSIKALINSTNLTFDMYQKSEANIEGDVEEMKMRLDNNSEFLGKKFTAKAADITIESDSKCSVNIMTKLILSASGNSEMELYGDNKIDLVRFADSAILKKKMIK